MSAFANATFSSSQADLFTPEEIRTLMRGEFDRAQRYRFPIVCMMVGVDRIESLSDLYGYDSKRDILNSVSDLLKGVTRASDFLGWKLLQQIADKSMLSSVVSEFNLFQYAAGAHLP